MVIAKQLGIQSWKSVFEKLQNKNIFPEHNFDWKTSSDYLPTSLWPTSEACKVLAIEYGIKS
jgi:hypothetical protein